jgi:hypothetical protein
MAVRDTADRLDTPLKIGDGLYRKERPSLCSASSHAKCWMQQKPATQTDAAQQDETVAGGQLEPEPENEPEPEAGPVMGMRF